VTVVVRVIVRVAVVTITVVRVVAVAVVIVPATGTRPGMPRLGTRGSTVGPSTPGLGMGASAAARARVVAGANRGAAAPAATRLRVVREGGASSDHQRHRQDRPSSCHGTPPHTFSCIFSLQAACRKSGGGGTTTSRCFRLSWAHPSSGRSVYREGTRGRPTGHR